MENILNLSPSSRESLALIEASIKEMAPQGDGRVLLSDDAHNFPFVIRDIKKSENANVFVLGGVADTLKRGRHHARIEFSLTLNRGRFL